jgi:hypothetical protein
LAELEADDLGPTRGDPATYLMPEDDRERNTRKCAGSREQVVPTHPAVSDLDQDVARADLRKWPAGRTKHVWSAEALDPYGQHVLW